MKTFIVTGIQMRNKGSQAMFLSLYSALRASYKDCEVIGFANKYDRPEQYTFKILPFDDYTKLILKYRMNKVPLLASGLTYLAGKLRKSSKWNGSIAEITSAFRRADAIFDASGYTLGSGWPKQSGQALLHTIRLAKRYNKKIILMPQSFGPFDWGETDDAEFIKLVKQDLKYPLKVYAREREGYDALVALGLENVELSADMVIREPFFPEAKDILVSHRSEDVEYPSYGSVGVIFNQNVSRIGDATAVVRLYTRIVEKLVEMGEDVYILRTSTADTSLVEDVLSRVRNGHTVKIIHGEYSSPELIGIISRFKYIVASRYHSVVFAYRSGVPAVILGWASKYTDLAELFQQQDYVFDIRNADSDRIITQIDKMGSDHKMESDRIAARLKIIQSKSVVGQAISALQQ